MSSAEAKITCWIGETQAQRAREPLGEYHRRIARWVIAGLTEQGIPIDKLLSGEMVALDRKWLLRTHVKISEHTVDLDANFGEQAKKLSRHDAAQVGFSEAVFKWDDAIKQAQLDYAGGQLVTPKTDAT